MPTLGAQIRAFWHDLTSNDRHASSNSPYRTGVHQPLPQTRHAPLTSVATTALDSRTDLESPYKDERTNSFSQHSFSNSNGRMSPSLPYAPGMKGMLRRQSSGMSATDGKVESVGAGEIQMQSFADGLPPPPPVNHSWKKMDAWLEDNYEELFENLGVGATINDVNELEHMLDCTLPQEVRDSLQCHDGQERGGLPTGAIFGCMLLDCEEIVQEWQQWRTINEVYLGDKPSYEIPQAPLKAFAGSSSSAVPVPSAQQTANPQWRQELLDKQDSQPTGAIQKAYSHPSWIPLARDWGGNNICVDLAPGPTGRWGQVILMGRDYDCKYVISRSWAAFLASVADDMNTDKWFIDEDSKELKLRVSSQQGVEPAYIDILRWRADQRYGRKGPKKRPLRINSQVPGGAQQANGAYSPYNSPTEDRGRSPQRLANGKAPAHHGATSSPRAHLSSPLARVTEETHQPQSLKLDTAHVDSLPSKPEKLVSADTPVGPKGSKAEKLVPVDTPVSSYPSDDENASFRRGSIPVTRSKLGTNVLSQTEDAVASDTPKEVAAKTITDAKGGAEQEVNESDMKDVQI